MPIPSCPSAALHPLLDSQASTRPGSNSRWTPASLHIFFSSEIWRAPHRPIFAHFLPTQSFVLWPTSQACHSLDSGEVNVERGALLRFGLETACERVPSFVSNSLTRGFKTSSAFLSLPTSIRRRRPRCQFHDCSRPAWPLPRLCGRSQMTLAPCGERRQRPCRVFWRFACSDRHRMF